MSPQSLLYLPTDLLREAQTAKAPAPMADARDRRLAGPLAVAAIVCGTVLTLVIAPWL